MFMNHKKFYWVMIFVGLVSPAAGEKCKESFSENIRFNENYNSLVFEKSSILISSRWKRPGALLLAKMIGATHLVWGYYSADPEFIKKAQSIGLNVHCALPYFIPSKLSEKRKNVLQCSSLDGSPVRGRWEVGWDMRRGDVNKASFRRYQLKRLKHLIDIGCDHFQYDGSRMNGVAVEWGGCFSPEGDKKFNKYLLGKSGSKSLPEFGYVNYLKASKAPKSYDFIKWDDPFKRSYIEFQKKETLEYYSWLHSEIEEYAGRHVFFSMNTNPHNSTAWLKDVYDGAMSEIHKKEADPNVLIDLIGRLQSKNKPVVLTLASDDVDLNTKSIATSYALGALMIYPWDVYISSAKDRYFGGFSDFSSLYVFIKNNKKIFDRYESYKEYVISMKMESTEESVNEYPVSIRSIQKSTKYIRRKQGQFKVLVSIRKSEAGNDKLVHLVNWTALNKTDQGYIVSFKKSLFKNIPEYLFDPSTNKVRKLDAKLVGDRIEIELDGLGLWSVFASGKLATSGFQCN